MKTLKTIQTLAKLGKILSKVVFIFCLIGGIGCAVGFLGLALGPQALKLGGVTFESLIRTGSGYTVSSLYAVMAAGLILCAGEAVLAKFAERYFRRELTDGTPFTYGGTKELQRLGILTVVLPLVTQTVAEVVYTVMLRSLDSLVPTKSFFGIKSAGLGVMILVLSLVCRYGTEMTQPGMRNEETV